MTSIQTSAGRSGACKSPTTMRVIHATFRPARALWERHFVYKSDTDQVVSPSIGRPSLAATSNSWSPLESLSSSAVIGSTSDVTCPLSHQLTSPVSCADSRGSETAHRAESRITSSKLLYIDIRARAATDTRRRRCRCRVCYAGDEI
ncbi:hypothetical protein EVAR_19754_1 [Eumeta japonica]|uniref:Uncharacterized protein n=1 Tax=Eumeta variegata TaxID=151549 RepID=A0A4C1UQG9_EUMVA|nr:hypothetical protein EVAR_19754_1 [Eumeta japonica]